MKHLYRFFGAPEDPASSAGVWSLTGEESHHLQKVLRLGLGAKLELCDGCGSIAEGRVVELSGQIVRVQIDSQRFHPPQSVALHVAMGALKAGFIDELLPSLVELGMDELHVFLSPGVEKSRIKEQAQERWRKISLAAMKQCKRAYLPQLRCWPSLAALLKAQEGTATQGLYLRQGAEQALLELPLHGSGRVLAVVGGEQGLSTSEELGLEQAGFVGCSLGGHTLRAYTAAFSATALLASKLALSPASPSRIGVGSLLHP